MNVLILGNGFDLAHNLPTTYANILNFFKIIKTTFTWKGEQATFITKHLCTYEASEFVKTYVKDAFSTRTLSDDNNVSNSNKSVQEIYDNLLDNVWYEYLLDIYTAGKMKGINWIDFESEISFIIEKIDRFQENLYIPFDFDNLKNSFNENDKLKFFLTKLNFTTFKECNSKNSPCKPTYRDFLEKSYNDLRRFVRCMEIYFLECVEKQSIDILSPDISRIEAHCILCFNYTHTYEKLYANDTKIKIHYLHGETQKNGTTNNMVLGIDEYYSPYEKDQHTNYNIYKKFTQRVINETGFLYRKWIFQMDHHTQLFGTYPSSKDDNDDSFPNNVYIFGHSLDITDKDVLKDIIDREGVCTTIFYHDKQQQTQQIANLVRMLGQDNFINMLNNIPQQIRFVQQKEMIVKK